MKITSVDISFPSPRSKVEHPQLLGFVSIVFDGCFVIHEIKIIGCENGKFLAFPSKEVNFGVTEVTSAHVTGGEIIPSLEKRVLL
jgi:DNA-binding cell septation regulator SpoVG